MKFLACILSLFTLTALGDPAAWHVRNGNSELYLLGSMHYLREQDYPLPPIIDSLYERADSLVMELDLDDLDLGATQQSFLAAGLMPAASSLQTVLDPSVYESVTSRAADLGLPLLMLERLKPWLIALTMMDLGMSRLGYQSSQGLEQYLVERSQKDSKQIAGLESVDDQINIFNSLSWQAQQALLLQTLTDLDAPEATMLEMSQAWRTGNLEELGAVLTDFGAFPELETALVGQRNRRWIGALEALLKNDESYLVVVGALHLVGRDSVVELLMARGYEVTRVGDR
jgi:uncharacterized protein